MATQNGLRPKAVLAIFSLQVILNWLYVLWVKDQAMYVTNPWFTLTPMFSFFYITFSIFAIFGLYKRVHLALDLAYWVILFGMIADVLSYQLGFRNHYMIEITIVPLIIMNCCVMCFMALSQSYFTKE